MEVANGLRAAIPSKKPKAGPKARRSGITRFIAQRGILADRPTPCRLKVEAMQQRYQSRAVEHLKGCVAPRLDASRRSILT